MVSIRRSQIHTAPVAGILPLRRKAARSRLEQDLSFRPTITGAEAHTVSVMKPFRMASPASHHGVAASAGSTTSVSAILANERTTGMAHLGKKKAGRSAGHTNLPRGELIPSIVNFGVVRNLAAPKLLLNSITDRTIPNEYRLW